MSKRLIMKRPRNRRVNCTSSAAGGRCCAWYKVTHCQGVAWRRTPSFVTLLLPMMRIGAHLVRACMQPAVEV